jgi:trimethylguanosine synthase
MRHKGPFAHYQSCRLALYNLTTAITKNVAYYVPRNTDPRQLTELAGPGRWCDIEKNEFSGKLKSLTAYYGDLIDVESRDAALA